VVIGGGVAGLASNLLEHSAELVLKRLRGDRSDGPLPEPLQSTR
jgi:hypothetical protein